MGDPAVIAVVAVAAVTGVATFVYAMRRMSRPAGTVERPAVSERPAPPITLDEQTQAEIERLLASRQKIAAIKLLREATGLGLKDAKETIDAFDHRPAGHTMVTPRAVRAAPDGLVDEARHVRDAQGPVPAVKLVRERTGWGLAEAKRFVDHLDLP